jgi:hypothetical protein
VRRDVGNKIVELPEVYLAAHPNVECAIHPGKAIAGVAVCSHVLEGAPVYLKEEPDLDRWGSVLCEKCAFSEVPFQGARIACEKCVRYHFSSDQEVLAAREGETNMSDQELMAMAETEGLRSYRSVRDGKGRMARNPFESPFMRWAWNLGFRLGRHLDEAKQQLSSTDLYSRVPQ